jgi:Protein of unknown function (DUF3313)
MFKFKELIIGLFVFSLTSTAAHAGNSGFLDDYAGLIPDPDRAGALRYIKEGVSLGSYNKIAIAPVEIWYAPDTDYKGISPDDLKLLADTFRELIIKELEPDYPVVGSAGPGVLGVRLAITNVKMKKKKRHLLNYTPIGFGLYTLKDIAGANVKLKDAIIEVELVDSVSGERLGALLDQQKETAKKGKASWEELEEALGFYAKRFRSRLDAEH